MKTLFSFSLALAMGTICMAADQTASININAQVRYQHVSGFGGFSPSPTWSYWLSNADMDRLFGQGDDQLGLNILRLYISNSKNGWSAGVANAKRAKLHGAYVFASPWSPPASWKDNNSDSNGGALLESYYDDWANYLNDYYLYMKQQGVTIDAVSVQNEPDWNASYQSCIWTGAQMAKFLREQGSKIECQIIAPEAIHFTKSLHEAILNDPEACANLDIVGGHFYGWDGSSYPLAAQRGKEVWMTEYLINERQEQQGVQTIDWRTDGFLFAASLNDAMLANMSAWVHYSLKRYYGCIGDGKFGTTDNAITKRGYILSHYAKYVSGTTRIGHSLTDATGRLSSSAYLSVTGDSVVVMVLNPSADTYSTTLTLPFYTQSGQQISTTETANVVKTALTQASATYQPVVSATPYSVNTYIFVKSAERTDLPTVDEEAESIFADGFDVAGASCIPAGWRSYSEEGLRYAGNYSLGPRIMSFSAEGLMQHAFYYRAGSDANGYVSYGEESAYPLALTPGHYTLSYSMLGWKATPLCTAQVLTKQGTIVQSQTATPTSFISSNGSSARITQTADYSLDFDISTAGNYVLRWTVVKSNGGFNETLVGNIKLVRHDDSAGISTLADGQSSADSRTYDLLGRQVSVRQPNTLYIRKGTKVMLR